MGCLLKIFKDPENIGKIIEEFQIDIYQTFVDKSILFDIFGQLFVRCPPKTIKYFLEHPDYQKIVHLTVAGCNALMIAIDNTDTCHLLLKSKFADDLLSHLDGNSDNFLTKLIRRSVRLIANIDKSFLEPDESILELVLQNSHTDTRLVEEKFDLRELYDQIRETTFYKEMRPEIPCFNRLGFGTMPNIFTIKQKQYLNKHNEQPVELKKL